MQKQVFYKDIVWPFFLHMAPQSQYQSVLQVINPLIGFHNGWDRNFQSSEWFNEPNWKAEGQRDTEKDREGKREREFNQCVPSQAVITPLLSLETIVTEWSQSACPSKGPLMCVGTKVSTVAFISLHHETAAYRAQIPFTPTTWSCTVTSMDLLNHV